MRNDLLGYLLGALDGPEHDEVHSRLAMDADLCNQLNDLESNLAPLERSRWDFDPPPGLAQATCQLVADRVENKVTRATDAPRLSSRREAPASSRGWDLLDVVVAAGIFMAASMLFFPAIANSRHQSRIAACQNKLRTIAFAFHNWADSSSGKLPSIPLRGKMGVAGIYAPQLLDANFVADQNVFVCPSSPIAQRLARQKTKVIVPTIAAIQSANGRQLVQLQRRMGGSFYYNLGHFEGGKYRPTRLRGRAHFAVLSDQTKNENGPHSGRGINVLFEDGSVRLLVIRIQPKKTKSHELDERLDERCDQLFVSDRGLVEAGCHSDDVVLAPSWARPNPQQTEDDSEQLLEF